MLRRESELIPGSFVQVGSPRSFGSLGQHSVGGPRVAVTERNDSLMKLKKFAATSALVIAAMGVAAGTASAAPAPAPVQGSVGAPVAGLPLDFSPETLAKLADGVDDAVTIGTLIGTVAGAIIGCVAGGSTGPGLAATCPAGIATGAGIGGVLGTIIAGGAALTNNGSQMMNAPA
jgi:hypothetical protein